ncbi:MAG: hypothetical protein HYX74_03095 [Acidobacteria bacterium]|nr:hypothetical protein [Acidobacteriota bacterium]
MQEYPWAERIEWLRSKAAADPWTYLLGAAVAVVLVCLAIVLVRRRSAGGRTAGRHLAAEDSARRHKTRHSIEKTLQELRHDDPQFVDLVRSLLQYSSIDRLLDNDEIEVAFGRLSYLQEKRKRSPKKRSSLLALSEGFHESRERRAAMLTVVRSCYASDEIYSTLDDDGCRLVDRFLDSVQ